MAGYHRLIMLPVALFFLVVSLHCLKVNPRPGEMLVSCPIKGDVIQTGLVFYGYKNGDKSDVQMVFVCNWPDGSDGERDCDSHFNVSLLHLGERRVDLSVPTTVFGSNCTFVGRNGINQACVVFGSEEADHTPTSIGSAPAVTGGSTPSEDTTKRASEGCADVNKSLIIAEAIAGLMAGLLLLAAIIIISLLIARRAKEVAKSSLKFCTLGKQPEAVIATTAESQPMKSDC